MYNKWKYSRAYILFVDKLTNVIYTFTFAKLYELDRDPQVQHHRGFTFPETYAVCVFQV